MTAAVKTAHQIRTAAASLSVVLPNLSVIRPSLKCVHGLLVKKIVNEIIPDKDSGNILKETGAIIGNWNTVCLLVILAVLA